MKIKIKIKKNNNNNNNNNKNKNNSFKEINIITTIIVTKHNILNLICNTQYNIQYYIM